LDGVTVDGTLDVGNTYNGANLTVTNGLVLDGTALVGNPTNTWYGSINFVGSQTLSGNGTVVFGDSNPWGNSYANALLLPVGGTTLTIGSGITVNGQNGTVGSQPEAAPWGGPANVFIVNQGVISADVGGGTLSLSGQDFDNSGNFEIAAGATIDANLSLSFDDPNVLVSQTGGVLNLAGNLLGTTRNADEFNPLGTLQFTPG
jgi:hypothetical protein